MKKKAKRSYFKDEEAIRRVGQRIREIRTSKKISQYNLANDYSQINRMELGKVNFSISSLLRIAKALGVDPKDFLDW
ncbi:MAG: helix-turn-helix domain-containing protein [Bacteroidota bacterium]|nr:helix-turn-helix domain-containing protein [Bacteroidota bacterium]